VEAIKLTYLLTGKRLNAKNVCNVRIVYGQPMTPVHRRRRPATTNHLSVGCSHLMKAASAALAIRSAIRMPPSVCRRLSVSRVLFDIRRPVFVRFLLNALT